jgi:hypothetical protein
MRLSFALVFMLAVLTSAALSQDAARPLLPPPAAGLPSPLPPPIDLQPDASGTVPQEQIRELLRRVAERDIENDKRLRDYTYIQREEEHKLDGRGNVKKIESRTSEVIVIYGEEVERLIAKDDKPLSEKDAKKEEERIQKITDKRKNESDSDRRKRLEKEEKDREDGRKFVKEVARRLQLPLGRVGGPGRPRYLGARRGAASGIRAEIQGSEVSSQAERPHLDRQGGDAVGETGHNHHGYDFVWLVPGANSQRDADRRRHDADQ